MGNQVKHLLIILSILLLSSPVIGQSEKPQTIIVPTGSLGDISEVRKKMLEKTLESKLDDYFDIVPKELFEEAQEQAFQEMDADECTEEQCIMMIREILQVENSFQMVLMEEEGDTQISLTWNDLDKKRVEEEYCEGCKTKGLRLMIGGLVEKLVGVKKVEVVVGTPKVLPEKVQEPIIKETKVDKTKGLFVTVGYRSILTSPNGKSWTDRTYGMSEELKEVTEDLKEVTYGKDIFVTVGFNGTILTSSNGHSWTKRNSGTKESLIGVTFGKGTFVVVGNHGTILTSPDGNSWTERISGTSKYIVGVTYGNGLFVTVGKSGTIHTSIDGIYWSERTSWTERTSGTSETLYGVTYKE